jgi:uncharacterized membrane protein
MWFLLALCSAVFGGARRSLEKQLLSQISGLQLGWMFQALSFLMSAILMLFARQTLNPIHLGLSFWIPLAIATLGFIPVNNWLFYGALKHGELSEVLPIQSLTPALSLILAWPINHEAPTLVSICGLAAITAGLYLLQMKGRTLHNPIRPFLRNKASKFMLGNAIAVALVGPFDKLATQSSNPLFYTMMSSAGATVLLFLISTKHKTQTFKHIAGRWQSLLGTGVLYGATYITFILALSMGPVGYVTGIKSTSAVIGAMAGLLALKESKSITKLAAIGMLAVGLCLLAAAR